MASSQQFPRSRRPEPVLITEARPSLAQQHAARKMRYALTMAFRAVCLVLAAAQAPDGRPLLCLGEQGWQAGFFTGNGFFPT